MTVSGADASRRIHVVAGALIDGRGRVLIAQRPAQSHQGGLWEFPGGKLEPGESPSAGLARELDEELGIRVRRARPLIQLGHDYPDRHILLDVYRVESWDGEPDGREGQPLEWALPDRLDPRVFPPADRPVITALRLPDLYLITPSGAPDPTVMSERDRLRRFLGELSRVLSCGAGLLQLRAHHLRPEAYAALVNEVAPYCAAAQVPLILNGEPGVLAGLPAAGWHLTSARLHAFRRPVRHAPPLIGASCHSEQDLALAKRLELDYALVSPVKATTTHPGAEPLGWDGFAWLARSAGLPVYALGGLTAQDLNHAWTCGARGIAAIRGLWDIGSSRAT